MELPEVNKNREIIAALGVFSDKSMDSARCSLGTGAIRRRMNTKCSLYEVEGRTMMSPSPPCPGERSVFGVVGEGDVHCGGGGGGRLLIFDYLQIA